MKRFGQAPKENKLEDKDGEQVPVKPKPTPLPHKKAPHKP